MFVLSQLSIARTPRGQRWAKTYPKYLTTYNVFDMDCKINKIVSYHKKIFKKSIKF